MQNKIFLHNEAVSLQIFSLSVPFRKGDNIVEKLGKSGRNKERKYSAAMLPSLMVSTARREMPGRNKITHIP